MPAEPTIRQAAGMLKIARPALIKLLEDGTMPHRRAGAHRRMLLRDLMA